MFEWLKRAGSFLKTELFTIGTTKVTIIALVAFAATVFVAAIIGRLLRRGINRYSARRGGLTEGMGYVLGRMVQLFVVGIGIVLALENLGLSLSTVAAVGAVFGVGIGLGLQGLARNFISGIAALVDTTHLDLGSLALGGGEAWTHPAAAGWGGDRWWLLERGGKYATVLGIVWDSEQDAREFEKAVQLLPGARLARRGKALVIVAGEAGKDASRVAKSCVATLATKYGAR